MLSAALSTSPIDFLFNSPEFNVDVSDAQQVTSASVFRYVNSADIQINNVIFPISYTNAGDISFTNVQPPQLAFLVVAVSLPLLIVSTIMDLHDPLARPVNLVDLATISDHPTTGIKCVGSEHSININVVPRLAVATATALFHGRNVLFNRTPGPSANLALLHLGAIPAAYAPIVQVTLAAAPALGLPPPAATTVQETKVEKMRQSSFNPLRRLLTRDIPPTPPLLSPTEFITEFVGIGGYLRDEKAFCSATSLLSNRRSGEPFSGIPIYMTKKNMERFLRVNFSVLHPVLSLDNELSSMSHECFQQGFSKTEIKFNTTIQEQHSSISAVANAYTCLCRPILGDADSSIYALFQPLLQILSCQSIANRGLSELFINQDIVSEVLQDCLFKFHQILDSETNSLPTVTWDSIVSQVHAIWSSIDIDDIKTRSLDVLGGRCTRFGAALRKPQVSKRKPDTSSYSYHWQKTRKRQQAVYPKHSFRHLVEFQ